MITFSLCDSLKDCFLFLFFSINHRCPYELQPWLPSMVAIVIGHWLFLWITVNTVAKISGGNSMVIYKKKSIESNDRWHEKANLFNYPLRMQTMFVYVWLRVMTVIVWYFVRDERTKKKNDEWHDRQCDAIFVLNYVLFSLIKCVAKLSLIE